VEALPVHLLNLARFQSTPLVHEPFPHLVVPEFIRSEARPAIHADYPQIDQPGSFPVESLSFGPVFEALLVTLQGPQVRAAFAEKFGVNLSDRPIMVTARGRSGPRDGNIHTDSVTKILTVLIYMNPNWEETGGRLRLLRSSHDLEDVLLEVPPVEGTLLAFRRTDNSWHGHQPFLGPRRVIQFNWVTSRWVRRRELFRHQVSTWSKRLMALLPRPQRRTA
jgi:hypothetical protein